MPTLDLHGGISKYAVYNGATDAPLTDPLNNLTNLLWHSDLPFIGKVATLSGSVDLNINSAGWVGTGPSSTYPFTKLIGPHGRSYIPIILGDLTIGGATFPAQGTFLAHPSTTNGSFQYNFYADETNIYVQCDLLHSEGGGFAALNCTYNLHIMNVGTDAAGNMVEPTFYPGFDVTTTYLRAGYFDTLSTQYMIADPAGLIGFTVGSTLQATIAQPKYRSGTYRTICLIFKYGSYVDHALGPRGDTGEGFSPTAIRASFK
jgi:hypothetical protein